MFEARAKSARQPADALLPGGGPEDRERPGIGDGDQGCADACAVGGDPDRVRKIVEVHPQLFPGGERVAFILRVGEEGIEEQHMQCELRSVLDLLREVRMHALSRIVKYHGTSSEERTGSRSRMSVSLRLLS